MPPLQTTGLHTRQEKHQAWHEDCLKKTSETDSILETRLLHGTYHTSPSKRDTWPVIQSQGNVSFRQPLNILCWTALNAETLDSQVILCITQPSLAPQMTAPNTNAGQMQWNGAERVIIKFTLSIITRSS